MKPRSALHALAAVTLLSSQYVFASSDREKNRKIEEDFIAAVQSFADKESSKQTISDRKDAISKALSGLDVHGWTGVVSELAVQENGDYFLALTVGDSIVLRSGGIEIGKGTMVAADSPLCVPLSKIAIGQKVSFDGEFLKDKAKGPNKGGLAGNRSFEQPEFAFQLVKIRAQKTQTGKSWKEIVAAARTQILSLHQAGGGKLSLLEFAKAMGFKMKGNTEPMLRDRGDLVFKATGENSGEFTNEGPKLEIKANVGHIEIPELVSGTYSCGDDQTVLKFSKHHTFTGKVAIISAPLESITADDKKVVVKIGGIMGGALSRTLPVE